MMPRPFVDVCMKAGEYVLTHGWVPIKDPYSFTTADHDDIAHG